MNEHRVFGTGTAASADPDRPPPTLSELRAVLPLDCVAIEWRSRRPLSVTARVRLADGRVVVVKRLPRSVRDPAALSEEHAFMAHLRHRGIPVPRVCAFADAEFCYELHELGHGDDRYRDVFSWSPYRSVPQAHSAGRMLARLHLAAAGYVAPVRPPRPLSCGLCVDPVAAMGYRVPSAPALARFLADRNAVGELAAWVPGAGMLEPVDLDGVEPLWTHNDWHGTNLLWRGAQVTAVIDFGLSNRTTAVFDLAIALERFAIEWLALRSGRPARIHADQLVAFLRGYTAVRPLSAAERAALPRLFPLVHVDYELSEIDYFLTVKSRPDRESAEIAYHDYLLGHLRWSASAMGRDFLRLLYRLTESGK